MISKTEYRVDLNLVNKALDNIPSEEFKFVINQPTGNFFYDPWILKPEFLGSIWEEIYNSIPNNVGQARIIKLESGKNYLSHADIDDRYHLNLTGSYCFLIDIDHNIMHPVIKDGIWYEMDAGRRHSAINFGNRNRYQLVIRKLLVKNQLINPLSITIMNSSGDPDDARFYFDDVISPWLNYANKNKIIDKFSYTNDVVSFDLEADHLDHFKKLLNDYFILDIK